MFVIRQNKLIATVASDLFVCIIYLHIYKIKLAIISNQDNFAAFSLKDFKK